MGGLSKKLSVHEIPVSTSPTVNAQELETLTFKIAESLYGGGSGG